MTVEGASVYRCTECGDGTRLHAWTHVVAYGPVGANGAIERYDWDDDEDAIIEESITCKVHGENSIEKLLEGEYTSAMLGGRFVSATVELATALLDESDVKYDARHRELYNLALRISRGGRMPVRPQDIASPQDIARFGELAEARTQHRGRVG